MDLHAEPNVARIFRWRKANPQYDLGHLERVERIRERAEMHQGLALAGNSYDGVGIPDCVRQAEEAVDRVMVDLTG
jgi:oxygen-dependent protoporphyrinogen oxidase